MKTCTRCGDSRSTFEFYGDSSTADGLFRWCKECCRARRAKYYQSNKNAELENNRQWAVANKERTSLKNKVWREKNSDRKKLTTQQWREANPDRNKLTIQRWRKDNKSKTVVYKANRRASKMNATPFWLTSIQKAQIQEFYDIAVAKTMQTGVAHQVDHIHPLQGKAVCGLHVPWNLQVITASENAGKSNKVS